MKSRTFLIIVILLLSCPIASRAEGIGSLIEVGKSMELSQKESGQETVNFENVRNAVGNGLLKKGQARQAIWSQFGEPVVINQDLRTKRERWVYKPASSSFFGREKIVLFFDAGGRLDEIASAR